MAMAEKRYTVKDTRRVDERGRRKEAIKVEGKYDIAFLEIRDALESAFRYFRAQVEHRPGRGWPKSGDTRDLVRGFIVSTQQLYAAAITLIADSRPKQLVMPAGVIARALVEGLGNFLAILDAPTTAVPLFLRDDYLNTSRKMAYHLKRFGNRSGYAKEAKKLAEYAKAMKLTPEEEATPEKLKEWPTPNGLLKQQRLTGERREVFVEIHDFWHRSLSALAHQRISALQVAVFTEEQPSEEVFLMVKSLTATLAVLVTLCVLSEVEAIYGLEPNAPLRVAWERMRGADEIIRTVYLIRYARLLKMDPAP